MNKLDINSLADQSITTKKKINEQTKTFSKLLILTFFIFSLVSCSTNKATKQERLQMWKSHLNSYKKTQWSGIAELNYKELVMRKNVVAKSRNGKFRMDLLDGGFMGLIPSSFASIYFDKEVIQYKIKGLENHFSGSWKDFENAKKVSIPNWIFDKNSEIWKQLEIDLINNSEADYDNVQIKVNQQLQINEISSKDWKIIIEYESNKMSEFSLLIKDKEHLHIAIDKISECKRTVSKIHK